MKRSLLRSSDDLPSSVAFSLFLSVCSLRVLASLRVYFVLVEEERKRGGWWQKGKERGCSEILEKLPSSLLLLLLRVFHSFSLLFFSFCLSLVLFPLVSLLVLLVFAVEERKREGERKRAADDAKKMVFLLSLLLLCLYFSLFLFLFSVC